MSKRRTMKASCLFARIAIILLLFGNIKVVGQELSNYHWGLGSFKGFIWRHSDDMGHLISGLPTGLELFAEKKLTGDQEWHQWYAFPTTGAAISYFSLKNATLGDVVSASAYMNFPFVKTSKSNLAIKIGTGTGYCTNPFNRETNNKNTILGSRFTFMMQARLLWNCQPNEHWQISPAVGLTHFSNGAFRLPNKGLNMPALHLNVAYRVASNEIQHSEVKPNPWQKSWYASAIFSFAMSEAQPSGNQLFPYYRLGLFQHYRLGKRSAWAVGMDGFYNLALKESLQMNWALRDQEKPDFKRLGLVIGHDLLVGKLSLITQLGYYIYRDDQRNLPFYQRYGLGYQVNNQLKFNWSLKTHRAQAEVVEWSVQYRLWNQK